MSNKSYMSKVLLASLLLDLRGNEIPDELCDISIDELYQLAAQNKVDLYFLDIYRKKCSINNKYQEIMQVKDKQRKEMLLTAKIILSNLSELGITATTFKSITPFPAVPNDIDILILDDIDDVLFRKIVIRLIKEYKYQLFDYIPYAVSLHDTRSCRHTNPKFKDPYDIDLYREVAANKVIYIDKRRFLIKPLLSHVNGVTTLSPEYELVVQCVHSVIPEQIFLMYHLLVLVSYLGIVNADKLYRVATVLKVRKEVSHCMSLTLSAISYLSSEVVKDKRLERMLGLGYYRFGIPELIAILTYRMVKDRTFLKSVIEQIVHIMRPDNLRHFLENIVERRIRKTY